MIKNTSDLRRFIILIKDLRRVFESGCLKTATIVQAPSGNGYLLMIDQHTVQRQHGGNRIFSSVCAAHSVAARIGFNRVVIGCRPISLTKPKPKSK